MGYEVIETCNNKEVKLGIYPSEKIAFRAVSEFAHQHVNAAKQMRKRYRFVESLGRHKAEVEINGFKYTFEVKGII